MPELPEVESLVRSLGPKLMGQKVLGVRSSWPKALLRTTPGAATRRLKGREIRAVRRRGKYFLLEFTEGWTLVGHLRMSGNLYWCRRGESVRFERHRLLLESGMDLVFSDARKFGRLWLGRDAEAFLGHLGPEPMDAHWSSRRFGADLAARRRRLKPLLLDQEFLAGLGNIYVDESLHRASLHPLRASDSLEPGEVRALYRGIRATLRSALRHGGTSFDQALTRADGSPQGGYQLRLRVYGRAGCPCRRCRATLVRTTVAQRGTTFCPRCQVAP